MKDAFSEVIFIILRISGHYAFTYDNNHNIFVKSKLYYIFSVAQSIILTILCLISTLYIFHSVNTNGTDKVRFDLILTTASNYCACAIIVFEKAFKNSEFIELNNRIWKIYFGKYYIAPLHSKSIRWKTFSIIFLLYIILPVTFAVLNIVFLISVVNDLKELICILIIIVINLWIFLAILPVVLLYWVLRNILYFLKTKIVTINDELIWNRENPKLSNKKFCEIIDDISIYYDELTNLIIRVTKLFSMHLLINLFIVFFHLSFNSYLALLYIERGLRSFDNFSWIETFLFAMTISYYVTLIVVMIHSGHRLISPTNKFLLCLHDLNCYRYFRQLRQSVMNMFIFEINF